MILDMVIGQNRTLKVTTWEFWIMRIRQNTARMMMIHRFVFREDFPVFIINPFPLHQVAKG